MLSCKINPRTSFKNLLSLNDPWPHSCPKIHIPNATVPFNNPYNSHTGAKYQVNGIN